MEYPSDVEIVQALRNRIKELEDGACRFNCRTVKEAFIAGYKADLQHDEISDEHAERAYQEWKDE